MPLESMEDKLKQFIIAVRMRSRASQEYDHQTTAASRTKLIIQIEEVLQDKKNRIPVLAAITGLPITSQNQLSQSTTSVLIDETIGDKSNEILRQIEADIIEGITKNAALFNPSQLYSWEGLGADMSNLSDAYME